MNSWTTLALQIPFLRDSGMHSSHLSKTRTSTFRVLTHGSFYSYCCNSQHTKKEKEKKISVEMLFLHLHLEFFAILNSNRNRSAIQIPQEQIPDRISGFYCKEHCTTKINKNSLKNLYAHV